MGYNTTIIVLNDHLDGVRDDPDFGRKVHDAVLRLATSGRKPVAVGHGALAVESHHSSATALVAVGGNYAALLGFLRSDWGADAEAAKLELAREIAEGQGYRLQLKHDKRLTALRLSAMQAAALRDLAEDWQIFPTETLIKMRVAKRKYRTPPFTLARSTGGAYQTKPVPAHTVTALVEKGVVVQMKAGEPYGLTRKGWEAARELQPGAAAAGGLGG